MKEASRSVRVDGKCYDAAAVNYVLYGLMGRLCGKKWTDLYNNLKTWKAVAYLQTVDEETLGWMGAGFHKTWPGHRVLSATPYSTRIRPTTEGWTTLDFAWSPYHGGRRVDGGQRR
jgi:hypothetical protein